MQRKRFISGFQIKLRIYIYSRHIFSVLEFAQYFVKCSLIVSATLSVLLTILLSALISKILDVLPLLRKLPLLASRLSETQSFFELNCVICRGTQRICSSHYLFPRGILLAGKNTGVSISWLANFVIDRGFAWELLTFSSISTRAGCRNSED